MTARPQGAGGRGRPLGNPGLLAAALTTRGQAKASVLDAPAYGPLERIAHRGPGCLTGGVEDLREFAAGDVRGVTDELRDSRIAAGLGIREVARSASLSAGTIRNIDAGVRSPTVRAAGRYAQAVGVRFEVFPAIGPVFFATKVWRRYVLPDQLFLLYRATADRRGDPGVEADQETNRWLQVAASHVQWARLEQELRGATAARTWQVSPKTLDRVELFYGWPSLATVALVLRHVGFRIVAVPNNSPTPWPPWEAKPRTQKEWADFRQAMAEAEALSRRNAERYRGAIERDRTPPRG